MIAVACDGDLVASVGADSTVRWQGKSAIAIAFYPGATDVAIFMIGDLDGRYRRHPNLAATISLTEARPCSVAAVGASDSTLLADGLAALEAGNPTRALELFESVTGSDGAYFRLVALVHLGRAVEALAGARSLLRTSMGDERLLDLIDQLDSGRDVEDSARDVWEPGGVVRNRWEVFGFAQGGMGRVHFVRDRQWAGLELAVKTLLVPPELSTDERALVARMFRREARVWLDLGAHPNIVSGFYTLELDEALRFFMEYVPGRSLDRVIGDAGRLPLAESLDLAIQLSTGMTYVHARGVVHRDLTPRNCLVAVDGTLRITDFGLGEASDTTELGTSLSARAMGTPPYMAPEQWHSLGAAGSPADVYTFGVVLHEMLAGIRPFDTSPECYARYRGRLPPVLASLVEGDPPPMLVYRLFHQSVVPLPLPDLGVDVPGELASLVSACLEKEPAKRPSFDDVKRVLLNSHARSTGAGYTRPIVEGLDPTESGENNRAVSYHVMGDSDRAAEILDAWLQRDPAALYPWINRRSIDLAAGVVSPVAIRAWFHREIRDRHAAAIAESPLVRDFDRRLGNFILSPHDVVRALACSPNGSTLIARGESGVAWLYDIATGDLRATLAGTKQGFALQRFPAAIDVSGDGSLVASAWRDGSILLYSDGVPLKVIDGHEGGVTALALDRRGSRVASAGNDESLRVQTIGSGDRHAVEAPHARRLVFSPDGAILVSEHVGSTVVRDLTGAPLATFSRDPTVEVSAAWASDGQLHIAVGDEILVVAPTGETIRRLPSNDRVTRLAATETDLIVQTRSGEIQVLDRRSGGLVHAIRVEGRFGGCVVSKNDRIFVWREQAESSVPQLRSATVWDLKTGALLRTLDAWSAPITCAAFDPTGDVVVTAAEDRTVRVWALDEPATAWPLLVQRGVSATDLVSAANERTSRLAELAAGSHRAAEALDDLRAKMPHLSRDIAMLEAVAAAGMRRGTRGEFRNVWQAWERPHAGTSAALAFSMDGQELLVGRKRDVAVWTSAMRRHAWSLPNHEHQVQAGAFMRDGRHLVTAGGNRVRVWDVNTRKERDVDVVGDLVVSIGTRWLVTAGDPAIRVYDAETFELVRAITPLERNITCLAGGFGDELLVGTVGNDALVIDLLTGETIRKLHHPLPVTAVATVGEQLMTAGWDQLVRIWDRDGLHPVAELAHPAKVLAAAVSPDGTLVATGSADHAVRLWRVADGKLLAVLDGQGGPVHAIAFAPDGVRLASATSGSYGVWVMDFGWELGVQRRSSPSAAGPNLTDLESEIRDQEARWTPEKLRAGLELKLALLQGTRAVPVLRALGRLEERTSDDREKPLTWYRRILSVVPGDRETLEAVAWLLEHDRQALEDLLKEQLPRINDRDTLARIHTQIGGLRLNRGDRRGARRHFDAAIAMQPGCLSALHSARELAESSEQWNRVVELIELEASICFYGRERTAMLTEIARLYDEKLRDPERALAMYERALDEDSDSPVALRYVFEALVGRQDWQRADQLVDRICQTAFRGEQPDIRSRLYHQCGVVKRHVGDAAKAADHLIVALEIRPANHDAMRDLVALSVSDPDAYDFAPVLSALRKILSERGDAVGLTIVGGPEPIRLAREVPLTIRIEHRDDVAWVTLVGDLVTGTFERAKRISSSTVIIVLGGVDCVSDGGSHAWRHWLRRSFSRDSSLILADCSVAVVRRLKEDPGFAADTLVKSFYAECRCPDCGTRVDVLLETRDLESLDHVYRCEACVRSPWVVIEEDLAFLDHVRIHR